MTEKKLFGEERREVILSLLKNSQTPITGGELATTANVSRQVIVGDITLLKAKSEPIIATSQGYLYMNQNLSKCRRVVACSHLPEETETELLVLVNLGITVVDVVIEHSVYGDLTASIMVSNVKEVEQFINKIKSTGSSYLSELTNGIHLHTLMANSETELDEAQLALRENGFLVEYFE